MPKFPPSRYSDHELPGVVADVCRYDSRVDPLSVSQTRFDRTRAYAGHPQAPGAKRICVRLKLSWDEVKRLALNPARNADRTVGKLTGTEDEPWLTAEVCVAALRTISHRIGKEVPLTQGRYEIETEQMLAESRRRHRHGRPPVLPTVGQIERRLGRWPEALKRAGLAPLEPQGSVAGIALADAIELCLEATGCLVATDALIEFFTINSLSLQRRGRGVSFPQEVEKLRLRRTEQGKWTPQRYTSALERPDLLSVLPDLNGPKRRNRTYDEDRASAALMQFVRERRGRSQTRRDYIKWAAGRDDSPPSASSMNRDGRPGFATLRTEARLRVREEENGQR